VPSLIPFPALCESIEPRTLATDGTQVECPLVILHFLAVM
jgi:hypothetical protein